jgi:hypothetical protein
VEGFFPAQEFGIDLGKFLQLILQLVVTLDASTGGLLLGWGFEEELVDVPGGQALGQKVKGPVLVPAMMAAAGGLAATRKTLDQRSAQEVGEDFELREKKAFALAQSQSGLAFGRVNPRHIYGKDSKRARNVNEKENAVQMRICLTLNRRGSCVEFHTPLTKSMATPGN